MSRIQNILEKAERDGAALRTSRLAVSGATATALPVSAPAAPPVEPAIIAPAAAAPAPALPATALAPGADASEHYTVRLNPLLVAGLAPKSLAAEQYRALRTRLVFAEGAGALRTVLITSPQKGEGKSVTSANLALTMAQELQRRVVLVEADLRK